MFEQIKKDSPDAFKVWNNYISKYDQLWDLKPLESVIGWLLTFFDEQRIVIQISYSSGWYYRITDIDRKFTINNVDKLFCGDRPEAWKSAIPKAFEILQKQLEEK